MNDCKYAAGSHSGHVCGKIHDVSASVFKCRLNPFRTGGKSRSCHHHCKQNKQMWHYPSAVRPERRVGYRGERKEHQEMCDLVGGYSQESEIYRRSVVLPDEAQNCHRCDVDAENYCRYVSPSIHS